jgi:hypothetical protein
MAQAQAVKPKSVQREVTQLQSLSLMKNLFRASLGEGEPARRETGALPQLSARRPACPGDSADSAS